MADRSRSSPTQHNLLPFNKRNNLVILQLVRKATAHLAGEERVVFHTVEEVIAGMALGDEAGNLGCDFPQFDTFRAMVRRAKKDQASCVPADGAVFGVFLCV